jgi:hypothetical protein
MTCKWTYNENYYYYGTECGEAHMFNEGNVEDNNYKYCPYCGRLIEEEKDIDG